MLILLSYSYGGMLFFGCRARRGALAVQAVFLHVADSRMLFLMMFYVSLLL